MDTRTSGSTNKSVSPTDPITNTPESLPTLWNLNGISMTPPDSNSPASVTDSSKDGSQPNGKASSNPGSKSSHSACKKLKLNYCEEAIPFYWLAQALLNILNSAQGPQIGSGWNAFAGLRYGEMLKSARMFVSDFTLEFALCLQHSSSHQFFDVRMLILSFAI